MKLILSVVFLCCFFTSCSHSLDIQIKSKSAIQERGE